MYILDWIFGHISYYILIQNKIYVKITSKGMGVEVPVEIADSDT